MAAIAGEAVVTTDVDIAGAVGVGIAPEGDVAAVGAVNMVVAAGGRGGDDIVGELEQQVLAGAGDGEVAVDAGRVAGQRHIAGGADAGQVGAYAAVGSVVRASAGNRQIAGGADAGGVAAARINHHPIDRFAGAIEGDAAAVGVGEVSRAVVGGTVHADGADLDAGGAGAIGAGDGNAAAASGADLKRGPRDADALRAVATAVGGADEGDRGRA